MPNEKSTVKKSTVKKSAVEKSLENLIRKIIKEENKKFYEEFLFDEIYSIAQSMARAEIKDDQRERSKYDAYDAEGLLKYLQEKEFLFGDYYEPVTPELAKKQAKEIYKALGVEWDTPLLTQTGKDWQAYPLWHLPKKFVESHKKLVERLKKQHLAKREENPETSTKFPEKVWSHEIFKAAGLEKKWNKSKVDAASATTQAA